MSVFFSGLTHLRHVIYDTMTDVLTFMDFNFTMVNQKQLGLKTVLFHSMELLSSNHLEMVTSLCPNVEWLSLDSALFYNLEGLGRLKRLSLLRLNYKSRPIDQTVVDFFTLNAHHLTTLQLFDVKDLHLDDLNLTVGQCVNLEVLVLFDCSLRPDWTSSSFRQQHAISKTVQHAQLINLQIIPAELVYFVSLFKGLNVLEMDRCDVTMEELKMMLLDQTELRTLKCNQWTNIVNSDLTRLQMEFSQCQIINCFPFDLLEDDGEFSSDGKTTFTASLLSKFANFAPLLNVTS